MKGEAEVIGRVTGYNYGYGSGNISAILGKGGGVSHVGSEGKGWREDTHTVAIITYCISYMLVSEVQAVIKRQMNKKLGKSQIAIGGQTQTQNRVT